MIKKINLFGIEFNNTTYIDTISKIDNAISTKNNIMLTVVNTASVVFSHKNKKMLDAIHNSDIVTIDGMPIVWVARLFGHKVKERVCGPDLFQKSIKLCAEKGYKPYFFGAKQEVLDKMIEKFKEKYPDLQIAGSRNGYYNANEEQQIADEIKSSKADMLFLGISSPKKELFIDKYTKYMDIPLTMGVGGSFDIIAGKTKRAPLWMQNHGLEWLYRIYQEPRRMWKRYLVTNTLFIYYLIKEILKKNH